MSLALHYWMRGAHHYSGPPVSEMTYTVSCGTLISSIPYYTIACTLRLAFGSSVRIWSCFTIQWKMTKLFSPQFSSKVNTKQMFGIALIWSDTNKWYVIIISITIDNREGCVIDTVALCVLIMCSLCSCVHYVFIICILHYMFIHLFAA